MGDEDLGMVGVRIGGEHEGGRMDGIEDGYVVGGVRIDDEGGVEWMGHFWTMICAA